MWICLILKKNTRVVIVVKLEKHVTESYIFDIIVCKFGYKQEPYQGILPSIKKKSKIYLYYTILSFS